MARGLGLQHPAQTIESYLSLHLLVVGFVLCGGYPLSKLGCAGKVPVTLYHEFPWAA